MSFGEWVKQPEDLSNEPHGLYWWLIWRHTGRPWTYVMRDFWHKHALLIIWIAIAAVAIALGIGCILGHVWWRG